MTDKQIYKFEVDGNKFGFHFYHNVNDRLCVMIRHYGLDEYNWKSNARTIIDGKVKRSYGETSACDYKVIEHIERVLKMKAFL